jgi:hypothetical protein
VAAAQNYVVSFYQAASEQAGGKGSPSTDRWQVSLGGKIKDSALVINAPNGFVPWEKQTLSFTATATSEVLSFLAGGTPAGVPPVALLDGVTLNAPVPEPAALTLVATIGAARLRRRKVLR